MYTNSLPYICCTWFCISVFEFLPSPTVTCTWLPHPSSYLIVLHIIKIKLSFHHKHKVHNVQGRNVCKINFTFSIIKTNDTDYFYFGMRKKEKRSVSVLLVKILWAMLQYKTVKIAQMQSENYFWLLQCYDMNCMLKSYHLNMLRSWKCYVCIIIMPI